MTREDAIYWIKNLAVLSTEKNMPQIEEALNMAIEALADRKTEKSSEKPNNCEYAKNPSGDVWECGCFLDTYCEHQIYDRNPDGTINIVECGYEPKDEPTISKMEQVETDINVGRKDEPKTQTETQNSNLTFKTLDYCDICDHKGCKECISNALDEHCIPSQFKKQIEDECAKEYEELGLKELKELIKADRKDEPQKKEVEWVYNKRERLWYPYSNGELLFKTEPQTCSFGLHTDCSLCLKESHCKAIKQAERKEREGE